MLNRFLGACFGEFIPLFMLLYIFTLYILTPIYVYACSALKDSTS